MHAHTHMHAYTHAHWNGPGGFKRKGGKCCRGNSCTYFLCFMTIVINVQAITHSHRRTSTAALEDLAISINVLCPSVAVSSFPFKKKKKKSCLDVIPCRLYLQLNCLSVLPCGEWKQWGFFFVLLSVVCQQTICISFVHTWCVSLLFFFFLLLFF